MLAFLLGMYFGGMIVTIIWRGRLAGGIKNFDLGDVILFLFYPIIFLLWLKK